MGEGSLAADLLAVKARQQTTWASGDYAAIGSGLQLMAELLCEAMDVRSGWEVLDVAAGHGNASLAAARRGCRVTSTDYVAALLERGRARAAAEGYRIAFEEADAENLPFAEARFDAVMSTVGVMFAPDQERAAAEVFRVCRPGGVIGLANWTPTGFVGQIFTVLSGYVPPPAGVRPPSVWGTEERLRELFPEAAEMVTTKRHFTFRALSAGHWLDNFRTFYGPMLKAFSVLDAERQARLSEDLLALCARLNRSGDGTLVLPSEYVEVVVRR